MTHSTHHSTVTGDDVPAVRRPKRVFMWVFLAVQAGFILWIVTGATSGSPDCGTLSAADCQNASDVGKTIGVGLMITLWVIVDIILGVTYAVVRLSRRGSRR